MPTFDAFTNMPPSNVETVSIVAVEGGRAILFDGTRLDSTSSGYAGGYDFDGGANSQIYLTNVSTNSMSSQLVGNIIVDGVACSATATFTMRR